MKDLLKAFSLTLREWQSIKAMLLHVKQSGKTTHELISYIDTITIEEVKFKENQLKQIKQLMKLCPICQAPMRLLPVNVTPGTRIEDDLKSVWICSNRECMNTIYNKESVKELRSKGGT